MLLLTKQHHNRGEKEYGIDKEHAGNISRVSLRIVIKRYFIFVLFSDVILPVFRFKKKNF